MTRINPAITDRVMEEIEKLRGSLTQALELTEVNTCGGPDVAQLIADMRAAISQQDQPTDTFTAVDMATAAAQGFRDGQAAGQAAAQDELRKRFDEIEDEVARGKHTAASVFTQMRTAAMYIRPAQTEQQPAYGTYTTNPGESLMGIAIRELRSSGRWTEIRDLNAHAFPDMGPHNYYPVGTVLRMPAAPIAQTAPQPEQSGLIKALEYYANGYHLLLANPDAWDTCSGEPMNFLHDEAGTASVEDGSIAKVALKAYRAALSAQGASDASA